MIQTLMLFSHSEISRRDEIAFHPRTDVFTHCGDLIIRIELAGLKDEDFSIVTRPGTVEISGNRTDYGGCKDGFYAMEIPFGFFRIEVEIPPDLHVDERRIRAQYDDGFLVVRCPRAKARRIPVVGSSVETD